VTRAKLNLTFPEHLISEPVIQRIGTEFGLVTNIHRANLAERGGWVILEVDGEPDTRGRGHRMAHRPGPQVTRIED
jgi:hypothetical protein